MKKSTVQFDTTILRFDRKGEKTGWTYVEIPADIASQLSSGKKSFRVKGSLDDVTVNAASLLPMGNGNFIMPLNASLRKKLGKRHGAPIRIRLSFDETKPALDKELLKCLRDEPEAFAFFKSLAKSHQNYFSGWVSQAKTTQTKANRIARTIDAMLNKMHYGQMLRAAKSKNLQAPD